jgi:hydrogenase maturation protease
LKSAKGILVGLGNPIMSDDGTGLVVSQALHRRLPDFDLDLSCSNGFDVVDRILGYRTAVIIDSMVTGSRPPGTVLRLGLEALPATLRSADSHSFSFPDAVRMAAALGAPVPEDVVIYGIEVVDPFRVGSEISPAILARVEAIASEIRDDVIGRSEGRQCTNSR